LTEVGGLGLSSPPPDCDPDRSRCFGRKLQAARCRHRKPSDFGNDRAKPRMAKPFLETCEHALVVAALHIDHARRRQPDLSQRRSEQIGSREAPQNLAASP
jgi:hypothetical protein